MTSASVSESVVSTNALDAIFREARTANTFTEDPVSNDQLRAIYELAKFGPTAVNSQPLRVLYVVSGAARQRLISHMSEGNRAKTASAPAVAVLAADQEFHEHLPQVFPHRPGAKDRFSDAQRRAQHAEFNGAIQIGYFIHAVRAVGLAAGPMGGFDRQGVDQEFFADRPWRSLVVVNIGVPGPDAWRDRLPRLDYDQAVAIA